MRRLISISTAAAALVAAALVLGPRPASLPAAAATQSAPQAAPASVANAAPPAQMGQPVREFSLTAEEVDWELFPGTTVRAWTYNGSVPGPELRVREGDLVRVRFENRLPVPSTVHWHGVDVPNAMDGVPGLTQDAVPPGGSFVYEFTATNPGTRWYHPHQDSELQTPLGLFGPLIIEPRTPPAGEPRYDREFTYVLSEWALALTPAVATGEASLPRTGPGAPHAKQLDFDLFLINGKAHDAIPPIAIKQGERIRVRLINAGALVHTMHPHGHSFKIVATDGNPVPQAAQLTKDSVTLGPSERVDLEIVGTNPGVWMFHCHMQHHAANGMMTTIRYDGVQPPVAAAGAAGHQHGGSPAPTSGSAPTGGASSGPAPVYVDPATLGNATRVLMTDNRNTPGSLTVPVGTTVAWINNGANLHTATAYELQFESGSIPPGKAWTFTFTSPGTYTYFCRQHLLNGMTGTIEVR